MLGRSPLDALSTSAREILTVLKRSGDGTVDELCAAIGLSPSAVRHQLASLKAAGIVDYVEEGAAGPGRRRRRYTVTDAADALFPTAYAELSLSLARFVADADPELLTEYFRNEADTDAQQWSPELSRMTAAERLEAIPQILGARKFLAEVTRDRSPRAVGEIEILHCPMLRLARQHPAVCAGELALLTQIFPDCRVTRTAHAPSGAPSCAYTISVAGARPATEQDEAQGSRSDRAG